MEKKEVDKRLLKWRLFKHGDAIEMANWPFIKDHFPNYEIFWSSFIAPSTGRDENPPHVHFKKGVFPLIEEIGMAHYTVFRCLCFILGEIKSPKEESLRNVYSHFGLIIELISELAAKIYILKCEVGLAKLKDISRLDKKGAVDRFQQYMVKDYDKQFKKFQRNGRPVVYFLQSRPDYLKELVNDNNILRKTQDFFREIKEYRNSFVHTALPDSLYLRDALGRTIKFAIKKERLGKYKVFTEIKHKLEQREIDDFIVEEQLITVDFYEIQNILDGIWNHFIREMDKISEQPAYKKLACL